MRVALCIRGLSRILETLERALPGDEVIECGPEDIVRLSPELDVIVPTVAPVPNAAYAAPRLKLVQQFGVGLDVVDLPAATAAGVLVSNVPSGGSGNAESVAELAIALMLMLSRDLPEAMRCFGQRRFGAPVRDCIWGSTVCIVGFGGIGREVARRLAGFGVRIVAVSRRGPARDDGTVAVDRHVAADGLAEAVAEADYVVVAAPATPENVGLFDAALFAQMKPGAFLVNVARGPVVDYDALVGALDSGRLAGAGLDVFWHEPFDPQDPLFGYNVIATPHIGGSTVRSFNGIGAAVAANLERLRRGELPLNCANPEAGRGRLDV
ncbi:MAG: 2-hydroxyacid dehydrogenase [Gammaproteobacteria bacterium]